MIRIKRVDGYSDAVLESVNKLLSELSVTAAMLNKAALEGILDSGSTHLFLAMTDDGAVGMLTLVVCPIPTGTKAWIEDVVVSESARNQGIGRQLVETAIQAAEEMGIRKIDLTSAPSREAALHLYQKCGFKQRETNVYRLG